MSPLLTAIARWYAADTPVIPDPIMQMSASSMKAPSLPSAAKGFAFGVSIQNERVGFGTGRVDVLLVVWSSKAFRSASSCPNGMTAARDMVGEKQVRRYGGSGPASNTITCRVRTFFKLRIPLWIRFNN